MGDRPRPHHRSVPTFLLQHHHLDEECGAVFVAWQGFTSPLRDEPVTASCLFGGHRMWWLVETSGPVDALALLPPFVAARTTVTAVRREQVP